MKNSIFLILVSVIVSNIFISPVYADVINPEFFSKKCDLGETPIICSYKSEKPFGPRTEDNCKQYENNPKYRNLTGHGSSFGGEEIYCFKVNPKNVLGLIDTLIRTKISYTFLFGTIIVLALASGIGLLLLRKK